MNYVELERKLQDSIRNNYPEIEDRVLLEVYRISRSIDWVNLFQNPGRSIPSLRDHLVGSEEVPVLIANLATMMVLHHVEFRKGTPENNALLDVIVQSILWRTGTKLLGDEYNDDSNIEKSELLEIFSNSPDLIVMYMLSQVNFIVDVGQKK